MVLSIFICTFISTFLIVISISGLLAGNRSTIRFRLDSIGMDTNVGLEDERLSKPFLNRIMQPVVKGLAGVILRITPKGVIAGYENLIVNAGMPYGFDANKWITVQTSFIVAVPALSVILGIVFKTDFRRMVVVVISEVLIGIIGPRLILVSKAQQRKKEIAKTLPNILDLITVSVESGLSFDAALGVVVEKMQGVLGSEFERVLQEIKMGKSRKEALKNMSNRVGTLDFTTFVASITQAEQLGVSMGNVLRIQSQQMRVKRRQRIQEKAMKAPVKMLIPMVLFIFPTIFTVILGPMVIKLLEMFKK